MATIRLLVAYDRDIKNDTTGRFPLPGAINAAINDANTIYRNSGVNQQLTLAGTLDLGVTNDVSNGAFFTMVNFFGDLATLRDRYGSIQPGQPFYTSPEIINVIELMITERKRIEADILVLWRGRSNPAGATKYVGVNPHDAFVTLSDSAMDGWTLAHEIAHLQGVHHEDAWYSPYRRNVTGYTTVMDSSENIPGQWENRVNKKSGLPYFSNPNVTAPLSGGTSVKVGLEYVFDSAAKLNFTAPLFATYGSQLNQPYTPREELNTLREISLGDQGEMWAIDENGCPWQWAWGDIYWRKRPLSPGKVAVQISAGKPGAVWCQTSDAHVWNYQNGTWVETHAYARSRLLSVGKDGSPIHVGDPNNLFWELRGGENWQSWDSPCKALKLATVSSGNFFIIRDTDKHILHFDQARNPAWVEPNPTMQANDISAGKDGTVWIINEQNQLAVSNDLGRTWQIPTQTAIAPATPAANEFNTSGNAVKISAVDAIRGIKLTNAGNLYRKVTSGGDWVKLDWKYFARSVADRKPEVDDRFGHDQ